MSDTAQLAPLFSDLTISADDATAIARALYDIAQSDGSHAEEISMIEELVAGLGSDLGETDVASLQPITPAALAQQIVDPDLRKVAVQCTVLLSLSDGAISEVERARSREYAVALGLGAEYPQIEATIQGWVESSDLNALF